LLALELFGFFLNFHQVGLSDQSNAATKAAQDAEATGDEKQNSRRENASRTIGGSHELTPGLSVPTAYSFRRRRVEIVLPTPGIAEDTVDRTT